MLIPTSSNNAGTVGPTLTPTLATIIPTATSTLEVTPTFDLFGAVMTASPPRLHASYPSPDQNWRVEIVIHDCVQIKGLDPSVYADTHAFEQLRLIEVSTGFAKIADSQYRSCIGLGAAGLDGRLWSSNSQYFYYTDAREGMPDGLCGYWVPPVRRLDVANQRIEEMGIGPFSPDQTKLATWQGPDFVVWSLDESEIGRSPAPFANAVRGPIAWSTDGESLVYLQTDDFCAPSGSSYVVRLDFPKLMPELLLESTRPYFNWVTWEEPDSLKLSDAEGESWSYDLDTKQLKPIP